MKNEAKFWDNIAASYVQSPIKDVSSWDETLERTRGYLSSEMDVLEVGAGTGSSALRLADAVKTYRATDFSPEMIGFAQEKLAKSDIKNLSFDVGRMEDEPKAKYDAVIAYNLLHLLDDMPSFLQAAHRTLKDGGVFISKSGALSGKYSLLIPPIWVMQRVGKAPYVNVFSPQKLRTDVEANGFEVLEMEPIPEKSMNQFMVVRKR